MSNELQTTPAREPATATRSEGSTVRYAVHVEGMRRLLTYLTEDCCQGQPELCGATFAAAAKVCRGARETAGE